MATFRIKSDFTQHTRGWSETWYTSQSSMAVLLGYLDTFLPLRAELLAKDVEWVRTMVTQVDPLGVSPKKITDTGGYPTTALPGDNSSTGVLVRMTTARKNTRSICMRGFPDAWIERSSVYEHLRMSDAGRAALDAFLANWKDFGVFLKARPRLSEANPGLLLQEFVLAGGNSGNTVIHHEAPDPAFQAGERIQVLKCKGRTSVVNGFWTVIQALSATSTEIAFPFARINGYRSRELANARVRLAETTYVQATNLLRIDIRTRKTGRAQDVPKGRNPNRPF